MTRIGAVETPIRLGVFFLRFFDGRTARREIAQVDPIRRIRHVRAPLLMNFMIAVTLCILIHIIIRHDDSFVGRVFAFEWRAL